MVAELTHWTPTHVTTHAGQPDWRRDMLGFLSGYRNPRTFEAYKRDMAVFVEWLEQHQLNPYTLERPHLQMYLRSLEERGYSEATVSRRFGTVTTFYGYLLDEEKIQRDPTRRITKPKIDREKQRRTHLTQMQANRLVEAALASSKSDLVLISFMLLIGMRVTEACSVRIEDIDRVGGRQSVKVLSKGNKLLTHEGGDHL